MTHEDTPVTPYMTLSHCWGTAIFLKPTTTNIEYLKKVFRIRELPKTFQETIMDSREFGVRYLWIDALCIVQDSAEDWHHAAAKMMKVCQNSHCNIATTGASDSEQGCFFQRDPFLKFPVLFKSHWRNARNLSYHFVSTRFWAYQVDKAPLNARGWVLQERLLSPRVLHYGKEQLFWECRRLDACETYPEAFPRGMRSLSEQLKKYDLDSKISSAVDPGQIDPVESHWGNIVEVYTSCDLTKAEDKLIAISGLARRAQSVSNDEYLAGLWKSSLLSQLLWSVKETELTDRPTTRPGFYRAPSWSWASLEAPIEPHYSSSEEAMITIVASKVDLATTDPTGQVTNSVLWLVGSVIPVEILRTPSEINRDEIILNFRSVKINGMMMPDVYPDIEYKPSEVFCLAISKDRSKKILLEGLVLEHIEHRKFSYKRIGYFKVFNDQDDGDRSWLNRDWKVDGQPFDQIQAATDVFRGYTISIQSNTSSRYVRRRDARILHSTLA